jgi:ribosome assembly protein RRB1
MPKRPANDTLGDEQPVLKAQPSSTRRGAFTQDEIGEFEDAWEDELESDEDAAEDNGEIVCFSGRSVPQTM